MNEDQLAQVMGIAQGMHQAWKLVIGLVAIMDDRTFSVRVGDLTAATASGLSRTTAAANATASVIRNKDMSPKVSVSTNVSTVVSVRAVTNGQTVVSAYNNRGTTNTWGGGR